jgi:hypothetical protein
MWSLHNLAESLKRNEKSPATQSTFQILLWVNLFSGGIAGNTFCSFTSVVPELLLAYQLKALRRYVRLR